MTFNLSWLKEYLTDNKIINMTFNLWWLVLYPSWLEYSPNKDTAFYLQYFLFNKPSEIPRHNAFVVDAFKYYKKKVRGGKDCAFINHIGNYRKPFSKVDAQQPISSTTGTLIQEVKGNELYALLNIMKPFCKACNIGVLNMNTLYIERKGQACHWQDDFTFENYYCAYISFIVSFILFKFC